MKSTKGDRYFAKKAAQLQLEANQRCELRNRGLKTALGTGMLVAIVAFFWFLKGSGPHDALILSVVSGMPTTLVIGLYFRFQFPYLRGICPKCRATWDRTGVQTDTGNEVLSSSWLEWTRCPMCGLQFGDETDDESEW